MSQFFFIKYVSLGIDQGCVHTRLCSTHFPRSRSRNPKTSESPQKENGVWGEDDVQKALPLESTVPLHLEDLQGVLNEDQPEPESRYQTLDQTGELGQPVGLFPPGVQGHQSDSEDQMRGMQGSEEQQPVGVNVLHDRAILEDQDQDI